MIDEVRHALNFEKVYRQFKVILKLAPQHQSFTIRVENIPKKLKYRQTIDKKYFLQNQSLNCFADPISIFEYLSSHFQDLQDSVKVEDGLISFVYVWGTIIKREKQIKIQLILEKSPLENATIQIDKLNKLLLQKEAMIKLKEKQNKEIQKKVQEVEAKTNNSIQQLQNGMKKKDKQIADLKNKLKNSENKLKQKTSIIIQLDKKLEQHKIQLNISNKKIVQQELLLKQLKDQYKDNIPKPDDSLMIEKLKKIAHHQLNSHQIFYSLVPLSAFSFKLVKEELEGYYNFINKEEILKSSVRYMIKITKSIDNFIMIGFCTKNGLGKVNNYKRAQSVYYNCYGSGYLWEEGVVNELTVGGSNVGDVLEVEADTVIGVLRWHKNGELLRQYKMKVNMQKVAIYLSILIWNPTDQIEISLI